MVTLSRGRARAAFAIAFVTALLAAPPLAAQDDDPWLGSWVSADVSMYVLAGGDDGYTGYFAVQAGLVPFTARTFLGVALRGSYRVAGADTNFEAIRAGGRLVVADPNSKVVLTRSDEPVPAEVLAAAQGGATTSAPSSAATPAASNPPVMVASDAPELSDPYRGFRISPLAGWSASPAGSGYSFQSADVAGSLLVFPHERESLDALKSDAREGFSEGTAALTLDGPIEGFGSRGLSAYLKGTIEGQPVKARLIALLSPHGGGLTLLAVARTSDFGATHESAAEALAGGIAFFAPRAPDATSEWRDRLDGARLTYLYSYYSGGSSDGAYVGASEETTIDLCSEGHFYYGSHDSFSADGGGAVGGYSGSNARGAGGWTVTPGGAPTLVLTFHDGSRREYTLQLDDEGKTLLNGRRYFRTYANSPVAEARPACP
ncbi:MAG: hypothetical protein R3E10_10180 [Gemmatimonadota bacterium]